MKSNKRHKTPTHTFIQEDLASRFFEFREPVKKPHLFQEHGGRDTKIRVIPVVRKEKQDDPNGTYVNCTSTGKKQLSPFYLGPCSLYDDRASLRMENAWQYSKVFAQHVGKDGNPTKEYFDWAAAGWASRKAVRHPMGKGTKPVFYWWDGEKLDRINARKRIYIPLYSERVVKTQCFSELQSKWEDVQSHEGRTLYLMDFDAYPYEDMTFSEVLNNSEKSMGHGFVLAMLLTDDAALEQTTPFGGIQPPSLSGGAKTTGMEVAL